MLFDGFDSFLDGQSVSYYLCHLMWVLNLFELLSIWSLPEYIHFPKFSWDVVVLLLYSLKYDFCSLVHRCCHHAILLHIIPDLLLKGLDASTLVI